MKLPERLKDLPFWTLHGIVAAAPSYFWALAGLNITWQSHAAMICGIIVLIVFYSLVSSTDRFSIRKPDSRFSRALRLAAHLRVAFVFLQLPMLLFSGMFRSTSFVWGVLMWMDLMPGMAALSLVDSLFQLLGLGRSGDQIFSYFIPVFLTTLVTGALFSVIFLVLSGVILFFKTIFTRNNRHLPSKQN